MKKLFFMGACLVALGSTPVLAQTGGPEVLVVRVLEESRLVTVWLAREEQAEPERLEFAWNDNLTKGKAKAAAPSYYAVFNKLFAQGYQLQTTIPGLLNSTGGGYTYSTLIFTRPREK